jgi:hypothetical protein
MQEMRRAGNRKPGETLEELASRVTGCGMSFTNVEVP